LKIKDHFSRMNRRAEMRRQFSGIKKWIDDNLKTILQNKAVVYVNESGEGRTLGVEKISFRNKKEYRILLKIDLMIFEKNIIIKKEENR